MFGDFQIEGGITIEPTLLEDNCKFVVTFCFNSGVYDISLESSEIEGLFTKIQNEKIRIEFPIPSLEGAGHPLAFHEDLSRWENLDDSDYSSINEHTIFMLLDQSIRPEYDDYSDGGFICTVGYLNFDLIKDGEVGFTKIDLNEFIAKTFQPPTFNTTHIINSKNNHTSSNQSGNNARFYQIIYALCVLLSIDDGNKAYDLANFSNLGNRTFKTHIQNAFKYIKNSDTKIANSSSKGITSMYKITLSLLEVFGQQFKGQFEKPIQKLICNEINKLSINNKLSEGEILMFIQKSVNQQDKKYHDYMTVNLLF